METGQTLPQAIRGEDRSKCGYSRCSHGINRDVEVAVTKIDFDEEPEILDISGKEATVQMTFKASCDAHLSYDDSSTGTYDSEEGRMLFMEHKSETLECEEDLVVEV